MAYIEDHLLWRRILWGKVNKTMCLQIHFVHILPDMCMRVSQSLVDNYYQDISDIYLFQDDKKYLANIFVD